jgi:ankyrin repeat protein
MFCSGWSLLHAAAVNQNESNVQLLFKHGGAPIVLTEKGRTALYQLVLAASNSNEYMRVDKRIITTMAALINGGVQVNHRDGDGMMTLAMTASLSQSIQNYLIERGAAR